MSECLDGMQGEGQAQEGRTSNEDDSMKDKMTGAIMIMLFLLNPVLGEVTTFTAHKRYCKGNIETLETAISLTGKKTKK